jgi:hypothetical protein
MPDQLTPDQLEMFRQNMQEHGIGQALNPNPQGQQVSPEFKSGPGEMLKEAGSGLLGAAGTALGGGGVPSMLMNAGIQAAFPAENGGDVAANATGDIMGGLQNKLIEPLLSKLPGGIGGALAKAALRAMGGKVTYEGTQLAHKLFGGNDPETTTGNVLSMGLPALAGRMTDSIKSGVTYQGREIQGNINKTIEDLTQGKFNRPSSDMLSQNTISPIMVEMKNIYDQHASQQKTIQLAKQEMTNIEKQKAQLLTQSVGSSAEDKLSLSAKQDMFNRRSNELTKANFLPKDDPTKIAIGQLRKRINTLSDDKFDPLDPSVKLSQNELNLRIRQSQAELNNHADNLILRRNGFLTQAAQQPNPVVTALDTRLDQLNQTVADAVNKSPIEMTFLKDLVPFEGNKAPTVEMFRDKLMDAYPSQIKNFFDWLGTRPGGLAQQQDVRDAMVGEFFKQAYNPKNQSLDQAGELLKAGGKFNFDKIKELYGGSDEGTKAVAKFTTMLEDINKLKQIPITDKWGQHLMTHVAMVLPTTLVLHQLGVPYGMSAITAEMGARSLVKSTMVSYPQLIDKVMTNSVFSKQFHKWVQQGAAPDALRDLPAVTKWMEENQRLLDPPPEAPQKPPQVQGQGQAAPPVGPTAPATPAQNAPQGPQVPTSGIR